MLAADSLNTTHELNGNSYDQKTMTPRSIQPVPGGNIRLGLSYFYEGKNIPQFISVLGYRQASYFNVTSPTNHSSLIQFGQDKIGLANQSRHFSFSGPYLHLILLLN